MIPISKKLQGQKTLRLFKINNMDLYADYDVRSARINYAMEMHEEPETIFEIPPYSWAEENFAYEDENGRWHHCSLEEYMGGLAFPCFIGSEDW